MIEYIVLFVMMLAMAGFCLAINLLARSSTSIKIVSLIGMWVFLGFAGAVIFQYMGTI
jgi:hypothetical protein